MSFVRDALDFVTLFPQAFVCGTIMAIVCSVFGVFVVLRRIVFVSIALSEAATCGLALAMVCHIPAFTGSILVTAAVVVLLSMPNKRQRLPREVVLGFIFLLASSASILLVSQSGFGLEEIKAMMYGDLIVSNRDDRFILLSTGLPALAALLIFIRPTMHTFFDREAARVMGIRCWFWETFYFFLLGTVVSGASKSGGALLVFCLLVIIPATALLFTRRMWTVIGVAIALGVTVTWGGLLVAYRVDTPANPTIIGLACLLFAAAVCGGVLIRQARRLLPRNCLKCDRDFPFDT